MESEIMSTKRERLTARVINALPTPPTGSSAKFYHDAPNKSGNDYPRGFGIRVMPSGGKSFALKYKSDRLITIGRWPDLPVEAARVEARKLLAQITLGRDPAQEQCEERGELTMKHLCDLFLEKHASRKRPATLKMYQKIIKSKILPEFGRRKISSITRTDVQDLHDKITDSGAKFQANRIVAVLRTMFNFGLDRAPPLCTSNPCVRIKTNPEPPRKRYLSPEETARLMAVLDRYPHAQVASLIKVMLWCGSRVGETMAARWDDIDLTTGIWVKPGATVKTDTDHEVPLSTPVLALLRSMRKAAPNDDPGRVWPGMTYDICVYHFTKICEAAGIENMRRHDLRHSFASNVISAGFGLADVGALLGHTTAQTTMRYAHLTNTRLREATEAAGKAVGQSAKRQRAG
jgi:integrase